MKLNNWMKQVWISALCVCLLVSGIPMTAFATESEETETKEVVIPKETVYLKDAEDILELAENCISDAWSRNKILVLENDIDLGGVAFEPIPTFGGTFKGQGYTISGFRLREEKTALGFFRYLQKTAVVEDLYLKGTVQPAKNGNTEIGGLVGVNSGTVRNCTFNGIVSGNERIGGIVGRNKVTGIIEGCTVLGVVFGNHYIGGIAGENLGVIRSSTNQAEVNSQVEHNTISLGSVSGLSLERFTARESVRDATNIGGIAGTSSGVIRGCENYANVGYEKMGYNVGGIAGSQIGYITECANFGTINGANGVGGITGQFKPNVVLKVGENPMSELMDEMIGLMGSMQGMMGSMQGMMGSMSSDVKKMEESMDVLKDPSKQDPDSIKAAVNEMSSAFNGMYRDVLASGSKMTGQMSGMMGSMSGMLETMEKLNEGMSIKIIDISKEDTPENTLAKISLCANHGAVHGENYAGGIAGIADIEDTTAQDDIQGQLNFSNEGEMIMRLVIRDCRNLATVSVTKEYAGGIVGQMTTGAVFDSLNIGNMDALNANFVGGIAGSSETYIVDSFSRSIMAGSRYVGGIAGYGTEVVGCAAVTDIAAETKFAGGILGCTQPLPDEEGAQILNNRYYLAGKNLGGIDGISYEGATAPMTIKEFLATEGLDKLLRTVTVRFIADGQDDVVLNVDLGSTVAVAEIPVLETRENELYQWMLKQSVTAQTLGMGETAAVSYISEERLSNILFDQTYEAVFDAKNMVIASEEKTDTGRSLALAVGAFDRGTTLHLTNVTEQESIVNGIAVAENWNVTVADIGVEKLHYHVPAGVNAENIVLYVKDASGNWTQRDFSVEGSYMIFSFTHGESGIALQVLPEKRLPLIPIAGGAAALLLIVVVMCQKSKAKKRGAEGEE